MLSLLASLLISWYYLDNAALLGSFTATLVLLAVLGGDDHERLQQTTVSYVLQSVLGPLFGLLLRYVHQQPVLGWERLRVWNLHTRQIVSALLMLVMLLPYDTADLDDRPKPFPIGVLASGVLLMAMALALEIMMHHSREQHERAAEERSWFGMRLEGNHMRLALVLWLVITVDLWAFEIRPVWYTAVIYAVMIGAWLLAWASDALVPLLRLLHSSKSD